MAYTWPTVGGSSGSWGTTLNSNLADMETRVATLESGGPSAYTPVGATAYVFSSLAPAAIRPSATDAANYVWLCDGTNDQTEINAAIDAVAALNSGTGTGMVQLVGPYFAIGATIILKTGIYLRGESAGTEIRAAAGISSGMISLYDKYTHATEVSHLFINGNSTASHGIYLNNYDVSHTQAHDAVPRTNPDTMHHLHHLFIRDCGTAGTAGHGIILWDWASRANKLTDIRVQSCSGTGVLVGCADSHFTNVEVGSSGSGGPSWSEGSTPSGATPTWDAVGHGFVVYNGNNMFTACKAWYSRGHGFYTRTTQNHFSNCQSQDNYRDGFKDGSGKNAFTGCVADSNNQAASTYAGFNFTGTGTVATGLLSFDRGQSWTQNYGIVVASGATYSYINGVTKANATAGLSNAAPTGTTVTVVQDSGGK